MGLVQPYGLVILISIILGYFLFSSRAQVISLSILQKEELLITCLLTGLVGARLYHVITEYWRYSGDWVQVLFFWRGGLGIWGGLLGGMVACLIYARRQEVSVYCLFDAVAPALLLGEAVGRFANMVNRELLPFAVYDAAWCAILLVGLLGLERFFNWRIGSGASFGFYALGYGVGRFLLEGTRVPRLWLGTISFTQLVSLIFAAVGMAFLARVLVRFSS